MTAVFLDTSAIVRRYARSEPGSAAVRALCAPSAARAILVARIASVEVASAFARKMRAGEMSQRDVTRIWRLFRDDWLGEYRVVAFSDVVYARAEDLLFAHLLRSYDAVHLASALIIAAQMQRTNLEFWTADRQQAHAATAEGLTVNLVG